MAEQQQRPTASARATTPEAEAAPAYKPHSGTIWLCEDRAQWERECRKFIVSTYGAIQGAVVMSIPTQRLGASHEIVVLFSEATRSPREKTKGKTVHTVRTVVQSPAVKCAEFLRGDGGIDDVSIDSRAVGGGIRVTNMKDETGKTYPGLCAAITFACMRDSDNRDRLGRVIRVPTGRAIYRADTGDLRFARDA